MGEEAGTADVETLKAELQKEKEAREKISKDFVEADAKNKSYSATLKNLDRSLKEEGYEGVKVEGNEMMISMQKVPKSQPVDPIENLEAEKKNIMDKFTNEELSEAEYYDKLSKINARIELTNEKRKDKQEQAETQSKNETKTKMESLYKKIASNYPDATNKDSELFKKMNELHDPDVSCDVSTPEGLNNYLMLAKVSKIIIDSGKPPTVKPKPSVRDFTPGLTGSGNRYVPDNNDSILDPQDTKVIEKAVSGMEGRGFKVKLGNKAATIMKEIFEENYQKGNIIGGDRNINHPDSKVQLVS